MNPASINRKPFLTNAFYSALAWGGPVVITFVATPLLIRGLGVTEYGYYSLAVSIISFGFTSGVGRVAAKYIPEYRALGKSDDLVELLSATFVLTAAVAVAQAVLLGLVGPYVVSNYLNIEPEPAARLNSAIYIICIVGPVAMIGQIFQSAAQGIHRFQGFAVVTFAIALLLNLGSVALALAGFEYITLIVWNLVVAILSTAVFSAYVWPKIPEMKFTRFARDVLIKVWWFAASIAVYQIITSALLIFERAYVVREFGAEALTYYVVPLMLGMYLHALMVSFAQAAVPSLNELRNDNLRFLEFYKNATRVILAVSTLILIGYVCLGEAFLVVWLGPDFASRSFTLLVIHSVAFTLIAYSVTCWILVEAVDRPLINAASSLVSSISAIVLIVVFARYFGVEGVAYGRLAGAILVLPLIPIVEAIAFGKPLFGFWMLSGLRLLFAAGCAFIVSYGITSLRIGGWPLLLADGLAIVIAYSLSLMFTRFFSFSELKRVTDLLKPAKHAAGH